LFFDLVFVFAVTQVTVLTAHHLDPVGVARSLLLFWMIWWAWTQFTWTLNPADTGHPRVQGLTLAATAVAFVMAASVAGAFDAGGAWFAVPYVAVRVMGLALQLKVDLERQNVDRAGMTLWVAWSSLGLVAVLIGAFVDPAVRPFVWLAAVGLDLFAAGIAGQRATWDLYATHLSERHGLFVIIAIGESLIVAGTAIAAEDRTVDLVASVAAAIAVACLLWWTYFGWLKDACEHAFAQLDPSRIGQAARDAFSLAHFPLVCGIVAFAVAIEEIVSHPSDPAPPEVVAALGIGIALVVGFSAVASRRLSGAWLAPRFAILAVMGAALAAVGAASVAPVWPLVVVAVALAGVVILERRHPGHLAGVAHPTG
jgi:low temperature requirement protein LtrA